MAGAAGPAAARERLSVTLATCDGDAPTGGALARCLIAPTLRADFVRRAGWGDARERLLAGDASFRKYFRLTRAERHRRASWMRRRRRKTCGRSCASAGTCSRSASARRRSCAEDAEPTASCCWRTWATTPSRACSPTAATRRELYAPCHRRAGRAPSGAPTTPCCRASAAYDRRGADRCGDAAAGLVPAGGDRQADAGRRRRRPIARPGAPASPPAARRADSLLLRDYHKDNLMWLPARPGVQACGLLDFQDAPAGPPFLRSRLADRGCAPRRAARRARGLPGALPRRDRRSTTRTFAPASR